MPLTCPKCGDQTLDYNPDFKAWRCLWSTCDYWRYPTEVEKKIGPLKITIFGEDFFKKELRALAGQPI